MQIFCRVLFSKNLLDFYEAHWQKALKSTQELCIRVPRLIALQTLQQERKMIAASGVKEALWDDDFYGNILKGKLYKIINGRGVIVLTS